MQKRWMTFVLLVSLMTLLVACNDAEEATNDSKKETSNDVLSIYTTVYPLTYFTEQIGGDAVDVQSIYPPGTDEHAFDPTQKEMMALAQADALFYIGLGLEGFVDKAKQTLKDESITFVPLGETIKEEDLHEGHAHDHDDHDAHEHSEEEEHDAHAHDEDEHDAHEEDAHDHDGHDHGDFDPHVWISPALSEQLAYAIKEQLIEQRPEQKEQFENNYEQLSAQLAELDANFKKMADEVPNDTFFVSHEAFGYIADRYGLEQMSVAGLNSQNEPSQKQLAELVKQAKEQNIQYVLFEQNVSSKLTEVVQKEIGAQSLTLHNLGVLTEEDIANNEDYFTLMERNIDVLREALQ